jgi:hypothetical protein
MLVAVLTFDNQMLCGAPNFVEEITSIREKLSQHLQSCF